MSNQLEKLKSSIRKEYAKSFEAKGLSPNGDDANCRRRVVFSSLFVKSTLAPH